ncbi:MBL fold metallo-hydrolase [Reyranella sp. CPCC 100927]|uniref:MBL fold metallo-hydrolase n=1 Tax=Reyranella sp. CPCC 100927 TaxID=2599616 RepID=UPI0011B584F8|nr:MBL fold metallo-hydrolase [Reyranella sp. CPCC 100927]TWS96353.1 MBL fold metallo-hydrolase [Reyranella sp. CPCC 100927]
MMRWGALVAGAVIAMLSAEVVAQTQSPPPPVREITKIAGDVYRFRNNFHYSVFAVTPAGVIATDPINADAAKWLKAEIKTRFNQPIKYVIYSHDHADHVSGGEEWADTATVIAHANAKDIIIGEKRPTAVPHVTFSDRMELELGGTVVELIYVGRNHSNNSLVVRFPKEKLIFAVDFIPVGAVAFRDFPDAYLTDWIESLRRVEAMEFDTLAPGHGPLGNKQSVVNYRTYMEDLYTQVLAAVRAGKSVEEIKAAVNLSKYESWAGYKDMAALNIVGMYRMVTSNRRPN